MHTHLSYVLLPILYISYTHIVKIEHTYATSNYMVIHTTYPQMHAIVNVFNQTFSTSR